MPQSDDAAVAPKVFGRRECCRPRSCVLQWFHLFQRSLPADKTKGAKDGEFMRSVRAFLLAVLILATVALVFAAGFGAHWLVTHGESATPPAAASSSRSEAQADFGVFWETWDILQNEFYGTMPEPKQRTYEAIKGLVGSLDDPYTYFVEPQPRQREKEELSGEFGGVGAWVSKDDQGAIRLKPMPDRAAERAGIQEGDILRSVDGKAITPEMTTDDVVTLIRGPVGTSVKLEIYRESTAATLLVDVVRERIETPSVEWRLLGDAPHTGYVAITLFSERTPKELDRALSELRAQGASRLILDLRHNPGGLLQTAVEVASRFLGDGVILYERKSDGSVITYRVVDAERELNWPLAILVDGATASASEIVAGALQDRGRAVLVGEKTFGKGSVQLVHDLSDGSSVHVTVAHWLTPNGHEINAVGLQPDLEVAHEDNRDAPLEAAVHLLDNRLGLQPKP